MLIYIVYKEVIVLKNLVKKIEKARTNLKIKPFNAERKVCSEKGMTRELLCAEWDNPFSRNEKIVAIGINPSMAHNGKSDNTITKLCRFLDMYGFDNLKMLNLYEDVSSVQLDGIEKNKTDFESKRAIFDDADIIVVVWGFDDKKDLRELKENANKVLVDYAEKLYCIENDDGKVPAHPSRMRYNWKLVPYVIRKKRLVKHRNMYGLSCEVESVANQNDFKIYCHNEHKICIPKKCNECQYFGGSEMGLGVCCVWEEYTEDIENDEHIVQHDEAYMEFQRVENPDLYKEMQRMIDDEDIDLCKSWQGLD